jgi:hypothetical protein
VERWIEASDAVDVAFGGRPALQLEHLGDFVEVLLGGGEAGHLGDPRLEQPACLQDTGDPADRDRRPPAQLGRDKLGADDRATEAAGAGADFEDPGVGQDADYFAQGGAADVEAGGERPLGRQAVAETQVPAPDRLAQGAEILPDARSVFAAAEMTVKVKEPQPAEVAMLEARHVLFTYLHLAPDPDLTQGLPDSDATCVANETATDAAGRLPLLAPTGEVAGRLATQAGSFMLGRSAGGSGVLLGGMPGVAAGKVLVIVGANAARMAVGWAPTSPSSTARSTACGSSTRSSPVPSDRLRVDARGGVPARRGRPGDRGGRRRRTSSAARSWRG